MNKFISVDRIFSKLSRDFGGSHSESDVIEWIGEALEFIGAERLYEEAVAFIEIKGYQCDIPNGAHSIIQVARNNQPNCCTPTILTTAITDECKAVKVSTTPESCLSALDDAVWLDCNGTPIVAYDLAYYRPYFDLQMEYYGWSNSSYYRNHFTPIRLATSTFFNSAVCQTELDSPHITCHGKDEYSIIERSKLRFNFEDGQVAVAYNKQMVDKVNGYPMIPDNISYITAITKYIAMKKAENDFDNGRQGAQARLSKYEQDWQWYCGQASNNDKMPQGIDEYQNLADQRRYLIPRENYFSFFGNMNVPEDRIWDRKLRNSHGETRYL